MKYLITGAVAALALFVTAGSASAQHPGGHSGHSGYSGHSVVSGHHAIAPAYHGGHYASGHLAYPQTGFGVGVYSAPVYGGVIVPPAPVYRPNYAPVYPHGQGHLRHHPFHH